MANLEKLLHELTKLVESLKLSVGDSHAIKQEIIRLNFVQEKLRNLQAAIAQELDDAKMNHAAVGVLSLGAESAVSNSYSQLANRLLTTGERFIAEKFGNEPTKLSLNDLELQISRWLEWGELLQTIAEDILSNSQFIHQLNSNINYPSLPSKFQELEEKLKLDLACKAKVLQQQIQQLSNFQAELLQVQQKSTEVFDNIKNTQNILLILLNLSAFCGNSGLELEWFDDEYGFIISSGNKCQALADIIYDCELFQGKIAALVGDTKNLLEKAETALSNLPQSHKLEVITQFLLKKPVHAALLIGSSLLILSFATLTVKDKIVTVQKNQHIKHEKVAKSNLKSAQKLGMEAAVMVQKSPLPLASWQEAESRWQKAVSLLEDVPKGTSVSEQAKKQLVKYRANYTTISKKVILEKNAASNLEAAEKLAVEAAFIVKNAPEESVILQQGKDKLKQAINLLQAIPEGTFVSKQVQDKLVSYKNTYQAIKTK
ncbi:hypothetical protein BV372_00320 [Nostoc sp. T09]|uniref:hypothetical protein n=1 Tax=Nostoc sp. T09 TaxID=1932621 RepID=UPI000A3BB517|nr:hypothetical protein [Nostoc sp. T09]OUL37836.1 hypothetical protein BV372_00320 [Nostoc sp. T09]